MSKTDKLLERFETLPKDFTWDEVVKLMAIFGFEEFNKGKTSGSRASFIKTGFPSLHLHKPHGSNPVKDYALKDIRNHLITNGLL